jgi:MSHA biogenesis protein MshI
VVTLHLPFFKPQARKPGWLAAVRSGDACLFAHVARHRGEHLPRIAAAFEMPLAGFASGNKLAGWKGTRVTTLLNTAECQMLQLDAPQVPRPEWKAALQWPLQEHLDFPVAKAGFDVLDIPTEAHAPGRQHKVYVVVAKNDAILSLMQSFDSAGLDLAAIDAPALALRNISALVETPGHGQACLYFDNDGGLLVVTFGGELYDFRRINTSLAQLGNANEEQKKLAFERINLELQRTFDSLDRQYSFIPMKGLSIAHRSELSGLPKYLKENLYVPVDLLSLQDKLDLRACPHLQQPVNQARFLLAIGAALRDEVRNDASAHAGSGGGGRP